MNRPYSGWNVDTESLGANEGHIANAARAREREEEENARLAAIGRNVAHDRLQFREYLGLAQGELNVLLLIVERSDHVLDLRAQGPCTRPRFALGGARCIFFARETGPEQGRGHGGGTRGFNQRPRQKTRRK